MKSFAILRDLSPEMTWEELDAAAITNMINMGFKTFSGGHLMTEPAAAGVSWVRTYWEQGSSWGTCLYTAPDRATVEVWHDLCQVPYAAITEVEEFENPNAPRDYPRGFHAAHDSAPLLALRGPASEEPPAGYIWIRTYRDTESNSELRLFLRTDDSPPPAAGESEAHRVVEIRPGDYQ